MYVFIIPYSAIDNIVMFEATYCNVLNKLLIFHHQRMSRRSFLYTIEHIKNISLESKKETEKIKEILKYSEKGKKDALIRHGSSEC